MEIVRAGRLRVLALLLINLGLVAAILWGAETIGVAEVSGPARGLLARLPLVGGSFAPPPPLTGSDLARTDALALARVAAERERRLEEREAEIAKAEAALEEERARLERWKTDLDARAADLARAQAEYDSREAEVRRLVTLYTGMRPQEAARVFERTDELLVVEILRRMPPTNASAILRVLDPEYAARLTRQMGLIAGSS